MRYEVTVKDIRGPPDCGPGPAGLDLLRLEMMQKVLPDVKKVGLLYCTAFIFGLAGTIVAILGVAVLVTYSVQNGIILLVIAFLVSPMGLPMAAAWLLGKLQALRYTIQDWIYG